MSTPEDRAKRAEYMREWGAKNRDKKRKALQAWREKNRETSRRINRESARRNRHKHLEYNRLFQAERRKKFPTYNRELKARLKAEDPALWRFKCLCAQVHKYGLTIGEWCEMMAKGCGLCGTTKGKLVVDHNHRTGKVRGILCNMHNTALGKFGDDPHILRAAIRWVGGNVGWQP